MTLSDLNNIFINNEYASAIIYNRRLSTIRAKDYVNLL